MTQYRTIVADPPWDHSDGTGWTAPYTNPASKSAYRTHMPYQALSVDAICELPISELAAEDAHLYLWTTNRYLESAYRVARAWGFASPSTRIATSYRPPTVLVWCKPRDQGLLGGGFLSNVEYVLFCRRGRLAHTAKTGSRWFQWPRSEHSKKPEAFLDMVESVSPGPYLELFARRQRLGWDTWGNESLGHVEMPA